MNSTSTTNDQAAPSERPALLPSAAEPTIITSHLPPIKSLRPPNDTSDRGRSPFRRQPHRPPLYTGRGLPNSNTLQTFLSVTDTPFSHHRDQHPSHADAPARHDSHTQPPKIDQNGIVERFIDNPTILTVGLAISLSAAVVGNLAIVLRFLEVLRPRQSIALAFAGFMLHDLINVVALATFGGIYGPKKDGLSLSASYWMVCASTITSSLVTISLVADYVRTKDFRHAGSGLTQLQKGLVLAGMGLLLYLSLGSLIFVFVIEIDFITALYFSCATILTVGFGDVVPTSPGGKVLLILYAPLGIVLVAIVVSAARNAILETFQATLMARTKERRRRIAKRRAAQKEHKRQDRALRKIMPRTFTFGPSTMDNVVSDGNGFAEALAKMEQQAATSANDSPTKQTADSSPPSVETTAACSSDNAKNDADTDAAAEKSSLATAGDPALQREISALQQHLLMAKQRTEEDFRQYEEHARQEAIVAARMKLLLAASVTAAFWLLGAVAFTYAEKWSYGGAMWFCFIAMITIGYGDYHPATQLGRAIFVIWGLMGVAVLTILLAVVQDAFGSIFHRVLTQSTSRLFDRAEARARKRRRKKQKEDEERRREEDDEEKDVGASSTAVGGGKRSSSQARRRRRRSRPRQPQRKSEGDIHPQRDWDSKAAAVPERKSMEACLEGVHRSGSPEPLEESDLGRAPDSPSLHDDSSNEHLHYDGQQLTLPPNAAARMEDTLVNTPQKLALAALQTFQHSVRVLHLHEPLISQAMKDVPALRHYYNSRQASSSSHTPSSSTDTQPQRPGAELNPEEALQNLNAAIRQTANAEYEKVAKLVVANLEFEHHLRVLLDGFQGLKDRVEGYKQVQLQRSRTLSMSDRST
ncbi:Outward-rectifier potassium channel TOK1 [Pseudozyma hubeiensis]|nr:Outward-rectifier potassium channel TOK1 [Pseudozyma hubeiensis]